MKYYVAFTVLLVACGDKEETTPPVTKTNLDIENPSKAFSHCYENIMKQTDGLKR